MAVNGGNDAAVAITVAAAAAVDPAAPRHRQLLGSARTNLPRWPRSPPAIDPAAVGLLCIGVGREAEPALAQWRREADALGLPCLAMADDADERSVIAARLAGLVVGWRLMIAAPAGDAARIVALAHDTGLIDAEITVCVIADGSDAVWCAHCRVRSAAAIAPGETLVCPGCATTLIVHHHFSPRQAALAGSPLIEVGS